MELIASLFSVRTHTNTVCRILVNVFENFLPERKTMNREEGVYVWATTLPSCYEDLYFFWPPNLLREEVSDSFLRPINPQY